MRCLSLYWNKHEDVVAHNIAAVMIMTRQLNFARVSVSLVILLLMRRTIGSRSMQSKGNYQCGRCCQVFVSQLGFCYQT